MKTTMLHEITPDELTEKILNGVKIQIDEFKKDFETGSKTDFFTRDELAAFLNISLFTVHNWTNKKIITALKIGNRTYFERRAIEEILLKSNTTTK
ncbi:hypothetical protein H4V97_002180 [Flavobacterium sp. CG_23.5]|uniref:helix-turn-helix domain-containing protein n=1 Tax=Flavobacterium sp. CG_23.5 TaxID=2760708 RepID=UPI001AE7B290|nr:helix-turn-helix domain-containing protein [Flavobacterium sp. CG_23.5]MBP2283862.1 hypothetical protein [Flavobacterium sp. CG_23.5]